jgi:hypothetical protein
MWSAVVVLLLWAADKHLLSKIWTLLGSTARQTCWSALTLYSNWKHTNDMIKDGYHVDFVYLYEPTDDGKINEIDLLAHFRHHINLKTFTHSKTIRLEDFIQLCCSPDSNFTEFNPNKNYELVVKYTFDHKKYIVVFDNAANVRFPIYTESEIRQRNLKNTGVITAGLLTVNEEDDDGIDIYENLKILAGPMENFYGDTEYLVHRHFINYTGLKIDVRNAFIKLLDFWGSEFIIKPRQEIIKLEK